jgi:hypothetical protein
MATTIISTIPDARSAQRLVDELIRSGGDHKEGTRS